MPLGRLEGMRNIRGFIGWWKRIFDDRVSAFGFKDASLALVTIGWVFKGVGIGGVGDGDGKVEGCDSESEEI